MKFLANVLTVYLFLISVCALYAQRGNFNGSELPIQPSGSPLFGKDIIIHNQPDRDQRNVSICSAFNGWLFAVYSYPIETVQAIAILKSTDNGITWELLGEGGINVASSTTRLDIVACGNSVDNLKIFVGYVYFISNLNLGGAYVMRYNAEPFGYEDELLKQDGGYIKDLALSSDCMYPSANSNPFSLGVLYSKNGDTDTLIFRSSSNGGMSLDSRHQIASSSNFFHKVSLNYGRSLTWNSGRYFAAWEEQVNQYSTFGHIYTSHSEPNFDSPFTKPVCLDSIQPTITNQTQNPVIACQYNDIDNDSANITEIVLFEKSLSGGNGCDIKGFYNLQAASSNYFNEFSVSSSTNDKIQPDISFNPFTSNFMMTYFDSTESKLPYLTNNNNLANPNSWNIISQAYNDDSNIIVPYPKVSLNIGLQDGMNVWIADGTNLNGIALFDSPYSTYTGGSDFKQTAKGRNICAYPNPCNSDITFLFDLQKKEKLTISLYNFLGQPEGTITDQYYSPGRNEVHYNVRNLPSGSYTYTCKSEGKFDSGMFIVTK